MTDTTSLGRSRSRRGQHRRELLLRAAADLIAADGFGAVSHRAVAHRAGLPLAATTYYFASLEDLLEQALRLLADRWLDSARTRMEQVPSRLTSPQQVAEAVLVVAVGTGEADADRDALAIYERYLEAGRHPRLRPLVVAYDNEVEALLVELLRRSGWADLDPRTARILLAQVDGAALRALAEGTPVISAVLADITTLIQLLGRAV